jgi:hypothetical protein
MPLQKLHAHCDQSLLSGHSGELHVEVSAARCRPPVG